MIQDGFGGAAHLVLSSRLVPDLDGGYTIATLARAKLLADAGEDVTLLTIDPGSATQHSQHRDEFVRRGAVPSDESMRNLFDEASAPGGGAAAWVTAAAHPGVVPGGQPYRAVADDSGRPVLDLPVIADDPDWHLAAVPIVLRDAGGGVAGVLDGFGALYRTWLSSVVEGIRSREPGRDVVVICESRQLGELIVGWRDDVRIVHTIHTTHLSSPYTADAPVNSLWRRWLAVADRFDAVIWPTPQQRDEVVARFGLRGRHLVVPNAVPLAAPSATPRDPHRVVMVNRLAPGKRVDLAIRAFVLVVREVPDAVLEVHGDGPEREALSALATAVGLDGRVVFRGSTADPGGVLDRAGLLLSTSAFEGQGLAVAEALAHGCPVVAVDVRYGPQDMLRDGGGLLVDESPESIATGIVRVLSDGAFAARLSAEARASAARRTPEAVAALLRSAVAV